MDIRGYLLPTLLATALHVLVLGALLHHWVGEAEADRRLPRHIQAQMIDLEAFTNNNQPAQSDAPAVDEDAQQRAEAQARAEAQRQAQEAQRQAQQAAEQRAQQEARQKAEAAARQKAEQAARLKAEQEAKRKAEVQAKQKAAEEARRQAQAKREAEEKARRAAEAKAQAEAKARAKAEAEAKAKAAAEAAARAQAEAARQQAAQRAESIVGDIQGYIQALVQRNWRIPATARNGMEAVVQIRLFGNGEIDQASIVKSSGDKAFDRSALQAVYRTERFERVAEVDPILFERRLRVIQVIFRPEGLRW